MKCSKCKKPVKLQVTLAGSLCLNCITLLEDSREPKCSWRILCNAKEISKGYSNRYTAYGKYGKEAYIRKFDRWLWKEAYYENDKGDKLILKFDRLSQKR